MQSGSLSPYFGKKLCKSSEEGYSAGKYVEVKGGKISRGLKQGNWFSAKKPLIRREAYELEGI
jgi:hypothetical protein